MNTAAAIALVILNVWVVFEVWHLGSGSDKVLVQLKLLTQETRHMADEETISAQALADLQTADEGLKTTVATLLTYIQTKLGGVDTDDSAAVEAVVADINAQTAAVLAAIAPPAASSPEAI